MPPIPNEEPLIFGDIKTARELGQIIRAYRKKQGLTLEKLSDLTHVGTRFLSELERGKETAELGKALLILNKLGIVITLHPRTMIQPFAPHKK